MADIKKALALKKRTNPAIKVLVEYHKNWYSIINKMLKEPEPKSNTNSVTNTKPKAK